MNRTMEEMRYFLEVVQAYTMDASGVPVETEEEKGVLTESKKESEEVKEEFLEELVGELKGLKETWLAYSSDEENVDTAEGVEKGLYKASEMLENLLETKYGRRL